MKEAKFRTVIEFLHDATGLPFNSIDLIDSMDAPDILNIIQDYAKDCVQVALEESGNKDTDLINFLISRIKMGGDS